MSERPWAAEALEILSAELDLGVPERAEALAELAARLGELLQAALPTDPRLQAWLATLERLPLGLSQGLPAGPAWARVRELLDAALEALGVAPGAAPEPASSPAPAEAGGPAHVVIQPGDEEIWGEFLHECPELLAALEAHLVASLGGAPFEALQVMRPLHTLKGICGMLGLMGFNHLFHACEDALQPYRQSAGLPAGLSQALLAAFDLGRLQVEEVRRGLDTKGFEVLNCAPAEAVLLAWEASSAAARPAAPATELETESEAEGPARAADNIIRIPVAKMDMLLEAVSELAICQAQVTGGVHALGAQGALAAEANRLEKISRQLQEVVLGLRMVPVQPLFTRVSRQAYDLAQRMGKPLRVELEGGETEMDKGLVEELFEPLLHLVRNALDHGLETPEARAAAGKPERCLLALRAFHQGGDFVLEMEDDGRGFDLAAIRAKALERGLLRPGEEIADEAVPNLLFHAGFSTAAKVTDLSGRGVGLDAVLRKVQSLKGSVSARGPQGRGAVFSLRLPLTMALMDAILVRVRDERFILPAASVLRFLAWDGAQRHSVGPSNGWYEGEGVSLPLVDLGADGSARPVAVHVSAGGREACLAVDEVLGKQRVVIKSLGGLLRDLPGLGGGAILADGKVGLILDLDALLRQGALAA